MNARTMSSSTRVRTCMYMIHVPSPGASARRRPSLDFAIRGTCTFANAAPYGSSAMWSSAGSSSPNVRAAATHAAVTLGRACFIIHSPAARASPNSLFTRLRLGLRQTHCSLACGSGFAKLIVHSPAARASPNSFWATGLRRRALGQLVGPAARLVEDLEVFFGDRHAPRLFVDEIE